jgi:hypothetical protein
VAEIEAARRRAADLPRTDMLDAISHTISAAIWFGLTTGYLTLTGRYTTPRVPDPLPRGLIAVGTVRSSCVSLDNEIMY